MNRIKIVNEDILHNMKNSSKQFRVTPFGGQIRFSHNEKYFMSNRRPKTPQQVFKSVIKQGLIANQNAKKHHYQTQKPFGYKSLFEGFKQFHPSSEVIQKKFASTDIFKTRPMTSEGFSRRKNIKTQKVTTKQDISHIKQQIDQVLALIKQQSQLSKNRMKARFSQYGNKKFGKYWNSYNVNLKKRCTDQQCHTAELRRNSINRSYNQDLKNKMGKY